MLAEVFSQEAQDIDRKDTTMQPDSKAIDVGHHIAGTLLEWRPDFEGDDISTAIMHALERYSITLEGPGESGLMGCLFELQKKIEARLRSI